MNESDEPQFMAIESDSDEFQKTISDAQNTLAEFKKALDDLPEDAYACVKFFIPEKPDSEHGANIWLMRPFFEYGYCFAQPFELPEEFTWIEVGQWLKFPEEDLMDWYLLTESGDLTGGYSLRYQRSLTPDNKKAEFDERAGVKRYL